MRHFLVILIISLVVSIASASSVQPPEVDWKITVPATIKSDYVKDISVGRNVFYFEETPLHKIRKIIGYGNIEHAGDAASSQYWLCYSFNNKTVWFISHGEMGGPSNVLTQVQAVSQNLGCPELKGEFQIIQTSFGWLGMSKNSLLQLIGKPSGVSGNVLKFFHLGTKPGKYGDEMVNWDIIGYIEVTIENNMVSTIYASHTTTY